MATFDYCEIDDVRNELEIGSGGTFTSVYDTLLASMITQASRLIDKYKAVEDGAYKTSDHAADETRYYFGSGEPKQRIDPFTNLTSVAVEETDGTYTAWTADSDFFTWPYNASQIDEPYRRLDINPKTSGSKSVWTFGPKRVKVVGKFGISAAVPETIKRATVIQAVRWYKRASQAYRDVGAIAELGQLQYVAQLDPDVKNILSVQFPHIKAGMI